MEETIKTLRQMSARVSAATWIFAFVGLLASMLGKIGETTQWSDLFQPMPVIAGLLGFMNGLLAQLSKPKEVWDGVDRRE